MKIKRGQILRNLRTAKGFNQSRLAKLLDVSLTAYQKYEHGTAEPTFDNLSKLADFYEVTTDYLLGREPKKESVIDYEKVKAETDAIIKKIESLPPEYQAFMCKIVRMLAEVETKQEEQKLSNPPTMQSKLPIQQQPVQPPVVQSSLQRQIPPQKSDIQILKNSEVAAARSRNGEYKPLPTDEQMESFEEVKPGMI